MDYCAGSQCIIYTHSMSHIGVGRLGNIIPPCSGLWEVRNDMLMEHGKQSHIPITTQINDLRQINKKVSSMLFSSSGL